MKENSIDFEKVVFSSYMIDSLISFKQDEIMSDDENGLSQPAELEILKCAREILPTHIMEIHQALSIGDFKQAKELYGIRSTFTCYNNTIFTYRNTSKSLVKGILDLKSIKSQYEFTGRYKYHSEWMTRVINRKEDSNSLFDGEFYQKINQEFQKLELKMHLPAFIDYAHKELLLYVEEWIAIVDQSLAYTEEHWDALLESV